MPQRETIDFPANIPVELSLKYATAKAVGDGTRALFSTLDNRSLFLDMDVARQIEAAGIQPKERFTITRKQASSREKSTWEIARLIGEQPNGTYVVPKDPEQPQPKPPARAEHLSTRTLAQEAKDVVDAYAEVMQYGVEKYGLHRIKPEELHKLFVSVYIQRKGAT